MSSSVRGLAGRRKHTSRHRGHRRILEPEMLEARQLLSTFPVTSTADDGSSGTLRWAIAQANSASSPSSIEFELGTSSATITLSQGSLDLSNTSASIAIYDGPGEGPVTVSGNGASQVLLVNSGVQATISGVTITGGSSSRYGGGIYNQGNLTLTDSTITANTAGFQSGGIFNTEGATLTIHGGTISSNTGEGLYNSGTATLDDCTISGNSDGLDNAFGTATLYDCTISGNTSGSGGGVFNGNAGTVALYDCTVSGNYAHNGGGLYNHYATMKLTDCTISGNSAYHGGGIENANSPATITACTISGNSARYGGGVYAYEGSRYEGHVVTLTDTIVAGNTGNGSPSDIGGQSAGNVTGTYNLIGTGGSGGIADGSNGNIALNSLADLDLGILTNNGGPTETMALLAGSAAIQAGSAADDSHGDLITTDQRGLPLDSPPDIGSFQTQNGSSGLPNEVTTTADSGTGSLRQAIEYADANGGDITIGFAIGTGQQTIDLLSPLPAITVPLTIDGLSQPGYAGTPLIELAGASAGSNVNGLTINAPDVTITGLDITGFGDYGLVLKGSNALIQDNYIGTDPSGSVAAGNTTGGIEVRHVGKHDRWHHGGVRKPRLRQSGRWNRCLRIVQRHRGRNRRPGCGRDRDSGQRQGRRRHRGERQHHRRHDQRQTRRRFGERQ